jgi:hypothetical protein
MQVLTWFYSVVGMKGKNTYLEDASFSPGFTVLLAGESAIFTLSSGATL